MKLWLECSVSGVGQQFDGTLSDAINQARESIRFPQIGSAVSIWTINPNRMIAKVWDDHHWVTENYRHLV